MELIRRLVFVGAEYEGYLSPDPTKYSNPIMVKDLTDHFVSFADSEISVERDGVTGTMTKVAYSLKFAKNDETLFLKECYERFITKGRSNYPRKGYETIQVKWIGTQKEFSTLTANSYNEGDIAWVVDGTLMECKVDVDSGDNYWATASPSMGWVNPNTIVYCVDIINNQQVTAKNDPTDLLRRIDKQHGTHTIEWAEKIGLGSRTYKLISIDK